MQLVSRKMVGPRLATLVIGNAGVP